jgi:hypothetical protein
LSDSFLAANVSLIVFPRVVDNQVASAANKTAQKRHGISTQINSVIRLHPQQWPKATIRSFSSFTTEFARLCFVSVCVNRPVALVVVASTV